MKKKLWKIENIFSGISIITMILMVISVMYGLYFNNTEWIKYTAIIGGTIGLGVALIVAIFTIIEAFHNDFYD